ncbi:MAG: hypothetical protein ACE5F9_07275 [Phycisphaerae bacterium]
MNRILRYRIVITLCFAAALVAVTAVRHGPKDAEGLRRDLFWATKITWRHCADGVIAGDSRACRGLAPEVMETELSGCRLLNFGFESVGYSEDYLAAIEAVLDPNSSRRVILLGITPYSLTPVAVKNNEFEYRRRWLPYQSLAGLYARESLRFLRPMPVDEVIRRLVATGAAPQSTVDSDYDYRADGWMAVDRSTGSATYLKRRRAVYAQNTVDAAIVQTLLRFVRKWRAAGIDVYAFRFPIAEVVFEIERDCSDFDEAAFVAALEHAGGVWIAIDRAGYATYDGSHLGKREAVRLSRALARRMRSLTGTPAARAAVGGDVYAKRQAQTTPPDR